MAPVDRIHLAAEEAMPHGLHAQTALAALAHPCRAGRRAPVAVVEHLSTTRNAEGRVVPTFYRGAILANLPALHGADIRPAGLADLAPGDAERAHAALGLVEHGTTALDATRAETRRMHNALATQLPATQPWQVVHMAGISCALPMEAQPPVVPGRAGGAAQLRQAAAGISAWLAGHARLRIAPADSAHTRLDRAAGMAHLLSALLTRTGAEIAWLRDDKAALGVLNAGVRITNL